MRRDSALYTETKRRYRLMVKDTPYPGVQCSLCGLRILHDHQASVDHIIPLSKGGSDSEDNFQIAHNYCNIRKGAGRLVKRERSLLFDSD